MATKVKYLTHLARGSAFIWAFKSRESMECCNDEKCFKVVMRRKLLLRPGVREKGTLKNLK